MAKSVADAVLDAALNVIKTTGVLVTVCNAEPTTYAQASATFKLADVASTSTDFTIANGDTSGRKVTVGQFSAVPVDTTGTATHIAICSGSALLYVTTCTSQALTSGNTVTIPAWKIEIADPS
jgi:hypothetical protein